MLTVVILESSLVVMSAPGLTMQVNNVNVLLLGCIESVHGYDSMYKKLNFWQQ